MNVGLTIPWTIDRFLLWAEAQDGRYEFDGRQPVPMVGGTAGHSRITLNIHLALETRLTNGAYSSFGPDLAIQTVENRIRFPDVFIVSDGLTGAERIAPRPLVVFEVISPSTEMTDRVEKVEEYALVSSILRYVIVESRFAGLHVYHRQHGREAWSHYELNFEGTLDMPEVSVSIPVRELYKKINFGVGI